MIVVALILLLLVQECAMVRLQLKVAWLVYLTRDQGLVVLVAAVLVLVVIPKVAAEVLMV